MKYINLTWGWLLCNLFVKPIIAFAKWEDEREQEAERAKS